MHFSIYFLSFLYGYHLGHMYPICVVCIEPENAQLMLNVDLNDRILTAKLKGASILYGLGTLILGLYSNIYYGPP